MANKRQRKKDLKKQETALKKQQGFTSKEIKAQRVEERKASNQILSQKGYTQKDLKNLSTKEAKKKAGAYKAAEKRKADRERRTKQLTEAGIPKNIIQRDKLYTKQFENLSPKQLAEIKRKALKEQALENLGVPYKKTDLRLGWDKLAAKYPGLETPDGHKTRGISGNKKRPPVNTNIKFTADRYLYVGFAETVHGLYREDLRNVTDDRLIELINDRLHECKLDVDGSAGMQGVFTIDMGGKSVMEHKAAQMYKRGYDMNPKHLKLDQRRYSKVTVSNVWTKRDFLELLHIVTHQTTNHMAIAGAQELKRYCEVCNLPFMDEIDI